jgi:hypothetical protein
MAFIGNGAQLTDLDAGDIASGTLPVARGGTGTASPSLVAGSGISVSGTWPNQTVAASGGGVTSLNGQTGAITNTDYGAIGSHTIAYDSSMTGGANTVYDANRTVSGSSLARYNGGSGSNAPATLNSSTSTWSNAITSLGLSGTWRQLTRFQVQTDLSCYSRAYGLNLYVRIS